MAKEFTRKYKIDGKGVNTLEARIYYSLGGMNWFTYKNEPRGYWFSLTPYESKNGMICYTAFSGSKMCVLPCERQSKKRYEEAKSMLDDLVRKYIGGFMADSGFTMLNGGDYEEYER